MDKVKDEIIEKLVHINRITKVVKGGRRFGFSALRARSIISSSQTSSFSGVFTIVRGRDVR